MRPDNRRPDELRPIKIKRRYTRSAPGSVLIQAGRTTVLCCAAVEPEVPALDEGQRPRLADRRIQHVARQHEPAQAPRTRHEC